MQPPVENDNNSALHPLQQAVIGLTKIADLQTIQKMVAADLVSFQENTSVPSLCFVNADDDHKTLLHYALIEKNPTLASYYCAKLPLRILNSVNIFGTSALHYATQFGFDEVIAQLLEANVSVLHGSGTLKETVLNLAIKKGNLPLVKILVAKLLNELNIRDLKDYAHHPSFYNTHGDTILHVATQNGFFDIVQFLVETKIPIDISNFGGKTPLLIACSKNFTKIASFLIFHKANVNAIDHNNYQALAYAVAAENIELVKLLLESGAIIKRENAQPLTMTHPTIIGLLFHYGAAIGENYPKNIAQLAPIIDTKNCLLIGTKIEHLPVANMNPVVFTDAVTDGQKIPITSLGNRIQESSILNCCKYALKNVSLNPGVYQTLFNLVTTRTIKIASLKRLLLHRFTDETFCEKVIKNTNPKSISGIPNDLQDRMETFFYIFARKNAALLSIEPMPELPPISNTEYLENIIKLEQEIFRLTQELTLTYDFYNTANIIVLIASVINVILIWVIAVILITQLNIHGIFKFLIGLAATFGAMLLGGGVVGCLTEIGNVTCKDSDLRIKKLQRDHYAAVRILQQWIHSFPTTESFDISQDLSSSLNEWSNIKDRFDEMISESSSSIHSFYNFFLSRVLRRIRADRSLIHLHFAEYCQFFKPYATIPSLFNVRKEQNFEFDIESNRLEM